MKLTDIAPRPNVLIVITDQEREVMHWPDGWAEANLPARQRLLRHGLRFTRAQCNTAACSSSRATFLTSLYPAQHGVKNLVSCDKPDDLSQHRTAFLSSRLPNLATAMAAAGYHVVLKGKLHLTRPVAWNAGMKRRYWSAADAAHLAERYGFHGWNPPDMSDPQSLSDLGGGAINNDGRFVDGSGTAAGHAAALDDLHRESAVHFLQTYDGDKPFCLIVALVNPHDVQEYPGRGVRGLSVRPTFARGGYRLEDFVDLPIDLPPNLDDDLTTKPTVQASFRKLLAAGTGHVFTRERQLAYARFYAYLNQQVDAQILKLLDALDARGLTDDTLIVRTSDHGELGLSHGRMRQKFYNVYRETLNVPLIVSNPRLYPEAQSTDALASLIDVVPTLAALAGTPEPEQYGFRGCDLTPVLDDPAACVQDVLHFTYEDDVFPVQGADCIRAIVERDWLGLSESASVGLSDLYVMPLQLGWHSRRTDSLVGVAFFAPTGRYAAGASDNLGKGMWSVELSAGGTVHLDSGRSLSLSTTAYWETHSKKDGAVRVGPGAIDDVTVGDLLTLEGGAGKSFLPRRNSQGRRTSSKPSSLTRPTPGA